MQNCLQLGHGYASYDREGTCFRAIFSLPGATRTQNPPVNSPHRESLGSAAFRGNTLLPGISGDERATAWNAIALRLRENVCRNVCTRIGARRPWYVDDHGRDDDFLGLHLETQPTLGWPYPLKAGHARGSSRSRSRRTQGGAAATLRG